MKLAERIQRITESPTLAVASKASAMKAEGIDLIDFSAGEPDFPTPVNVKNKGIEAIRTDFTRYTPSAGIKKLRQAVAGRYQKKYNVPVKFNEVILSNGGKQALFNAMFCLVQDGDEVLIPEPYWVTFPDQVRLAGGNPVFVPTHGEHDFVIQPAEVEKRITERTRVLILNSPNNPSGAVLPRDTLSDLIDLCLAKGVYLVYDECYDVFVFPPLEHTSPMHFFPRGRESTVIINTFSKVYAMTGWRLGFAVAPADLIAACDKVQSHTTSNPCSISQMAAIEALEGDQHAVDQMFREYSERRDYVLRAVRSMPGLRCSKPQGAFYLLPDISAYLNAETPDSVAFCEQLLEEAHVATVPGAAFGMEGHFRISYATSMDNLRRGCKRIQEFLAARKPQQPA